MITAGLGALIIQGLIGGAAGAAGDLLGRDIWERIMKDPEKAKEVPKAFTKWVQATLLAAGYELAVDGERGPETEAVLKQFQQDHGADVDAIVGTQTIEKFADALVKSMEKKS